MNDYALLQGGVAVGYQRVGQVFQIAAGGYVQDYALYGAAAGGMAWILAALWVVMWAWVPGPAVREISWTSPSSSPAVGLARNTKAISGKAASGYNACCAIRGGRVRERVIRARPARRSSVKSTRPSSPGCGAAAASDCGALRPGRHYVRGQVDIVDYQQIGLGDALAALAGDFVAGGCAYDL